MNEKETLLRRLDAIGRSLAKTPQALALIGLGSVGLETDRLDKHSDLDLFVIVEPGCQAEFLADLSWLSHVAPIAFYFKNSEDGYKLLFRDGIFCEFAVFEPEQLAGIPFSPGRIVWKAAGVSDKIAQPLAASPPQKRDVDWLVGEALTNLYVGLGRELRGERLSAFQFIQGYAIDRLVDLSAYLETAPDGQINPAHLDIFDPKRRYEARYPSLAKRLPQMLQGYQKNRESALAILNFLDYHYDINPLLKSAVLERINRQES